MSLELVRRPNTKYWYARGTINGERVTVSLRTADKDEAEKRKSEVEHSLRSETPGGGLVTFAYAAQAYATFRQPSNMDGTNIARLVALFGKKLVSEVTHADLVRAANIIKPEGKAATKNRHVMIPGAAILHYAANNGWREWIRIKKFKEPEPKTRYVTAAHEAWLLEAAKIEDEQEALKEAKSRKRKKPAPKDKALLLLWLFRQGDRISDTLRTRYEDCDLVERTVRRHISKTDTTIILPLDDEICAILRVMQEQGKTGRIFHWKYRWGVEKWIRQLCSELEIEFTPHRARHTVGKRLSDAGVSLRLIMDKLGHKDSKSSLRYQRGDVESVRHASQKLVQKTGE